MSWNKIRFFYETMLGSAGSTLSASSTASGYDVKNIYNMLEGNFWKAASVVPPATITYDAGAGNTKTADYIAVIGHNLFTAGASFYIEYSDNNVDWTTAWSTTPTSNKVFLGEFSGAGAHRYWRIRLFKSPDNFTEAPYMAICIWGNRTELEHATPVSFDPNQEEVKANVNVSDTGYLQAINRKYSETSMDLFFEAAGSALYTKVKDWWDKSGLNNFFIGWETQEHPAEVYLMRPDPKFGNPFKGGGLYRDISIKLKGRKE